MTNEQIQLLVKLQELKEKGVITDIELEREKSKILGEQSAAISVDDSAFTLMITSPESRQVFDDYNAIKNKIRKSFINRFFKERKYLSLSVNRRVKRVNLEGEQIHGAELISRVAREFRDAGFNVDEAPNHIKVHQTNMKIKDGVGNYADVFGIVTYVIREKSWEIQCRFDVDIWKQKFDEIGAIIFIIILTICFFPCICLAAALNTDEAAQKEEARLWVTAPLENAIKSFAVTVI